MIRPVLIPYKAEHSMAFVDRSQWHTSWNEAFAKEKGVAYTGMYGNEILGCAGIVFPRPGFGIVWLTMSPIAAIKFKVWMTKTCKRVIDDVEKSLKLYRIEAVVDEDSMTNRKWIERLGFTSENGHATHYMPNGGNVVRYERIKNG